MLEINELSFGYERVPVFDNTNFKADVGKLTVIKGESGIGKTTLLDIIALKHGNVFDAYYNGLSINEDEYLSNLYYMNQQPVLCNHLKIEDQWNILSQIYGINSKFNEYISLMGLDRVKQLYPSQLSGGEKLRVALLNIFIIQPKIVLMDEPTASLDDDYKNKFVDLLHILKENCHLIVSTHDPHIFNEADVLYEINNHKLYIAKSNELKCNNNLIDNIKKTKKYWFKEFLKMKKQHIIRELITLIIIAIPFSFFAYSVSMNVNFISLFQENLSSLEDTHILIYKPLDKRYKSYSYYYKTEQATSFPIKDDELNIIKKIDGIKEMTPKIILPTYYNNEIDLTKEETYPKFKIYKNNKEIYNYQDTIDKLIETNSYDYSVLYIEGIEDYEIEKYASKTFNNNQYGIFLNEKLLSTCGLTKDDIKGGSVTITVGIPMYDIAGSYTYAAMPSDNSSHTLYADDDIAANGIWYASKEITLPIRGIIKSDNDLFTSDSGAFYMSSNAINKLANSKHAYKGKVIYYKDSDTDYIITKNKEEAVITEVYTPWQPNAYVVEVNNIKDVSSVVDKLEKLGYSVDWKYNDYKLYGESIKTTQQMIRLISIISIIFITLIFIILHFIKGNDEKRLNSWFESIGYHDRKSLLLIKSQKYLLNCIVIIILSYLIFWIIDYGFVNITTQLYVMKFNIILALILVVLLTQFCIPMLWEVIQNVETRKSYN